MRPIYLSAGAAIGLLLLVVSSFALLHGEAHAQPLWQPPLQAQTPTPTPAACTYTFAQGTGTIVPGTIDINNHCDDCTTLINLPFNYQLYGQTFTTAAVSSNGNIQFASSSSRSTNSCLPTLDFNYTIFAHWDDLVTDCFECGVYTSISGSAPNRIFNIEWRASHYKGAPLNFEARLYETSGRFDLVYGDVPEGGIGATVGVQRDQGAGPFTQYECNTAATLSPGMQLVFTPISCGGGTTTTTTATSVATSTRTGTPTRTATRTATRTSTGLASVTTSASPTACHATYGFTTATGAIEPGDIETDNHCDDCVTELPLPFPVSFYGQLFSQAFVSSNGNLQFISANPISFNVCLPEPTFQAAIMPHWDDLLTDDNPGCPGGRCGVFTKLSGTAPERVFTVEWRAVLYSDPFAPVNFQVKFYEGRTNFDFVYGTVSRDGSDATVGVQDDDTRFTQFSCLAADLAPGLLIQWDLQGCATTTTPTRTGTVTRTTTPAATATPTACGFERFTGSITNNDPTQAGRLLRDEVRSTCQFPKSCPAIEDSAARHYDSYVRMNTTGTSQCVTVGISTMCQGTQFVFAAAYLDSFNPNSLCKNYLADIGASPYPHGYMSFILPAGRSAHIVVSEVTTNQGCPQYTLTITGLGTCGTATPTVTGTPPTATRTSTATPTPCGYTFTTATATIVPGTLDTGNHCDDCVNSVTLPFPFTLYGETYSSANLSSNGNIQFVTASGNHINACFPAPSLSASLLPNWTDLVTDCTGCGIYTSLSGTEPNRIFNIEWRAGYFKGGGSANFEARLYEGTGVFDFVYGHMDDPGTSSTVGAQNEGASAYARYSCNAGGLNQGLLVRGIPQLCGTATSTPINTSIATVTLSRTPQSSSTPVRTSTPICTLSFTDVPPDHTFYANIRCLACRGIVSGYNDGTFRPYNNITRGQIAKIVSNAAGFSEPVSGQRYEDVLPTNTFYEWIERLSGRGHMGGYPCGQRTTEPCIQPDNRPYFRPTEDATRGQLSKIVSNAAGYNDPVSGVFYADVDESNPFYVEIMRLTGRGVMSGYPCGGPGEPCDPQNRPYFRWGNPVTRGQASKIVANTFFPECSTP
jgi:hypothetical protein